MDMRAARGRPANLSGPPLVESLLAAWAGAYQIGIAIFDGAGTLVWCNPSATKLLNGRLGLAEGPSNVLTVRDRKANAPLAAFVAETGHQTAAGIFCLENGPADLVVCGEHFVTPWGEGYVGLRIYTTDDIRRFPLADLSAKYNLTTAEQRVLNDLLTGSKADEIAEAREISVETVRTHVRRLYAKMNVSSREGLFFTALQYRAP